MRPAFSGTLLLAFMVPSSFYSPSGGSCPASRDQLSFMSSYQAGDSTRVLHRAELVLVSTSSVARRWHWLQTTVEPTQWADGPRLRFLDCKSLEWKLAPVRSGPRSLNCASQFLFSPAVLLKAIISDFHFLHGSLDTPCPVQ